MNLKRIMTSDEKIPVNGRVIDINIYSNSPEILKERSSYEQLLKYYNEKRIKEKLGWMSPVEYRLNTLAA